MSPDLRILFDPRRCLDCWGCEIACQQWHNFAANSPKMISVEESLRGEFPAVSRLFSARYCHHCSQPACLQACTKGAISKRADNGIVVVDPEKCDGCKACLDACEWGIPQFRGDGKMQKCDLCLERVQQGQPPICVASCPTGALGYGEEPGA